MIGAHERTQPGYRANLSPTQQDALFELWSRFFRLCETPAGAFEDVERPADRIRQQHHAKQLRPSPWTATLPGSSASSLGPSAAPSRKASREQLAANGYADTSAIDNSQSSRLDHVSASGSHIPRDDAVKSEMQGLHEAKEMRNFIAKYGGQRLRTVFWQMVKGEHPDAIMLRLLRARKWNVDRAVAVLGSTAAWRVENDVENIVKGAELELTSTRGGMNILRNGISYIYGATAQGEPVYLIEVGRHFSASQTQDELKRAVILLQETLQSCMPPPTERKVVIFNMNEFGIRNMDWWCVFFMVKTMECFYVETLARVYVHGAPWIFKPIWSILKPLLDPVVRDKIRLTFDAKELEEYIPLDHLCKDSMKGAMDWQFEYPLPDADENDLQLDTATREALQENFYAVCYEYERATRSVGRLLNKTAYKRRGSYRAPHQDADDSASIVGGPEYDEPAELAALKGQRDVLATKMRVAWLKLRPYQAGKTKLDRWNVMRADGTIVWEYPKVDGTVERQVLGEATSLPALEENLRVLEGSQAGNGGRDGQVEAVAAQLSATGLQGSAEPHRVTSKGSGTSEVRGPNGNKKSSRSLRDGPQAVGVISSADAAAAAPPATRTNGISNSVDGPRPETRPSTAGSSSAFSHPSTSSSAYHSTSTIQPLRSSRGATASPGPGAGAGAASLGEVDTPATSVHPLEEDADETTTGSVGSSAAAASGGNGDAPSMAKLNAQIRKGGDGGGGEVLVGGAATEAEVPVHPLDRKAAHATTAISSQGTS